MNAAVTRGIDNGRGHDHSLNNQQLRNADPVDDRVAQGGKLFAQFKQVHDGFRDAVQAGRFKNRSVSLYKDLDGRGLSLRHVGFLGATAPQPSIKKNACHAT